MKFKAISVDGDYSEPADTVYRVPDHIETVFVSEGGTVNLSGTGKLSRELNVVCTDHETATVVATSGSIKGPAGFSAGEMELGEAHKYASVTLIWDTVNWHII